MPVEASVTRTTPYPFATVELPENWAAGALQWTAAATADTKEDLLRLMSEQVALFLLDHELEGTPPPAPLPRERVDVTDYDGAGEPYQVIYVEPAPVSEFSIAILRAMAEQHVDRAELARRMGVSRTLVTRITDPFYFGHTSNTLRRVAGALGRSISVTILARPDEPEPYRLR